MDKDFYDSDDENCVCRMCGSKISENIFYGNCGYCGECLGAMYMDCFRDGKSARSDFFRQ